MNIPLSLLFDATALAAALLPPGIAVPYGGDSAPEEWLLAAGQAVSRTVYARLFDAYGTKYGAGDGSTTFNLPDLRGRVVAGKDDMGGTAANRLTTVCGLSANDTLGATGGGQTLDTITSGVSTQSSDVTAILQIGGDSTLVRMAQPTIILNYIIKT